MNNITVPDYAIKRAIDMRVSQELGNLDGQKIFPTSHPMSGNSNVLTMTREFDGRHYVIPTMVDGKEMDVEAATDLALENGLDNYPSYDDPVIAREISNRIHDRVNPKGIFTLDKQ